MTWNYRVVKKKGLDYYGVIEVYYDAEGNIRNYSDFIPVCGDSLQGVEEDLQRFVEALKKPVLLEEELQALSKK